jgi:hypothetical protein
MQHMALNDDNSALIGRVSSTASAIYNTCCLVCGIKTDQTLEFSDSNLSITCQICTDTSTAKKNALKASFALNLPQSSTEIIDSISNDNEISPFEKLELGSKSDLCNLTTRTNSIDGYHHNEQLPLENADLTTSISSSNSKGSEDPESRIKDLESQLFFLQNRNAELEAKLDLYTSHNESIIHLDFAPGIYNDLEYENTNLANWKKVYYQPYSHVTTMEEIQAIRKMCKPYSLVCVGAVHKDAPNVFVVCAVDFGFVALQRTYSTEEAAISQNGVGWYCVYDKSFGFAPEEYIALECSDTADMMKETKHKRLSWKLNGGTGHRVGDKFHCSNCYYKVILIRE